MIDKKLVWRTAAKFDDEFSITELIEELSKEVSKKDILGERYYYKYEDILNVVSLVTAIDKEVMTGKTRLRPAVKARHIAMYLIYKYTQLSTVIIGRIFNRDHATVIHGRRVVEDALNGFDPMLKKIVDKCEKCVLMQKVNYTKNVNKIEFKDYKTRNIFKGWDFDFQK